MHFQPPGVRSLGRPAVKWEGQQNAIPIGSNPGKTGFVEKTVEERPAEIPLARVRENDYDDLILEFLEPGDQQGCGHRCPAADT